MLTRFLNSLLFVGGLVTFTTCALAEPFDYQKAIPHGFENSLEGVTKTTVAGVVNSMYDGQVVSLQGRLTQYIAHEQYLFQDETGSIQIELDDDKDWSHLAKDALIQIDGVVERQFMTISIDVKQAFVIEPKSKSKSRQTNKSKLQ